MLYNHPLHGSVELPDDITQPELDGIMGDLDRQAGQAMANRAAIGPLAQVAYDMANPRPTPRPVSTAAAMAMSPQQLADVQNRRQGAYEFETNQGLQREEMMRREAMQQQELMARSQLQQQQIGAQTKHYENMTTLEKMRYEAQDKRAIATAEAKAKEDARKAMLDTTTVKGIGLVHPYLDSNNKMQYDVVVPEKEKAAAAPKEAAPVTMTYEGADGNTYKRLMTREEAMSKEWKQKSTSEGSGGSSKTPKIDPQVQVQIDAADAELNQINQRQYSTQEVDAGVLAQDKAKASKLIAYRNALVGGVPAYPTVAVTQVDEAGRIIVPNQVAPAVPVATPTGNIVIKRGPNGELIR